MLPAINRSLQKRQSRVWFLLILQSLCVGSLFGFAMCCILRRSQPFEDNNFSIPFDRADAYYWFMVENRLHNILRWFTSVRIHAARRVQDTIWSHQRVLGCLQCQPRSDNLRLTIDESVNQWKGNKYEEYEGGMRSVPAKPRPIAQEYKILADPATNILLQLILSQDKTGIPTCANKTWNSGRSMAPCWDY